MGTGPEAKAVMMFGSRYNVFGTGFNEKVRPLIRIEELSLEGSDEVLILKILSIFFFVEFDVGFFFLDKPGLIPFRILTFGSPSGNRVEAPMDKDAKFGLLEPRWHWAGVKRFPGRLIDHY
jgi:hypothetical protein